LIANDVNWMSGEAPR